MAEWEGLQDVPDIDRWSDRFAREGPDADEMIWQQLRAEEFDFNHQNPVLSQSPYRTTLDTTTGCHYDTQTNSKWHDSTTYGEHLQGKERDDHIYGVSTDFDHSSDRSKYYDDLLSSQARQPDEAVQWLHMPGSPLSDEAMAALLLEFIQQDNMKHSAIDQAVPDVSSKIESIEHAEHGMLVETQTTPASGVQQKGNINHPDARATGYATTPTISLNKSLPLIPAILKDSVVPGNDQPSTTTRYTMSEAAVAYHKTLQLLGHSKAEEPAEYFQLVSALEIANGDYVKAFRLYSVPTRSVKIRRDDLLNSYGMLLSLTKGVTVDSIKCYAMQLPTINHSWVSEELVIRAQAALNLGRIRDGCVIAHWLSFNSLAMEEAIAEIHQHRLPGSLITIGVQSYPQWMTFLQTFPFGDIDNYTRSEALGIIQTEENTNPGIALLEKNHVVWQIWHLLNQDSKANRNRSLPGHD